MFPPFTEKAPAKINLALHVLGRRDDGYHELDSIVTFADLGDVLAFAPASQFSLSAEGPFATALPPSSDNIITRALDIAREIATARGRSLPGVAIRLTKNLPVAAGIGGGSANGGAALRALLRLAGIDSLDATIMAAALRLGADVPVCLRNRPCRMGGIGEKLMDFPGLSPMPAVLVNPGLGLATASVFGQLGLRPGEAHGTGLEASDNPFYWRNDLTVPAKALAPAIGEVLEALSMSAGVSCARMSGSGATCFGVFATSEEAARAAQAIAAARPRWWVKQTVLG
ncbi:MAG: 4-(cytidine 5'-diphospho)-2-C-methyl-D-erythritol kinase [Alphaproteobacteria bacterium]|nr:4-(cytidine 5'-diphospho)-2-C-methyl-D-erythritol kinase [Alphaproteobacteria bacterium]